MTIAIPVHPDHRLYHDNPCTAPRFALYDIEGPESNVQVRLKTEVDNPLCQVTHNCFDAEKIACSCNETQQKNIQHISEHYALLEAIAGCSYLLADRYCANTSRTLKNGGIELVKIPPFIDKIESAIKNFLIGASLANQVQHIHHAS